MDQPLPNRRSRSSKKRVMSASIGGVIQPHAAWKLRILARELDMTINNAAELAANHLGHELGISFEEIPEPRPTWMVSRIEYPITGGTSPGAESAER